MTDIDEPTTLGGRMRRARLLKSLREPTDITAVDIAKALGVSSQSVGSWERDEKRPGHDNLVALATFLGVREAWLAFGEPPMVVATSAFDRAVAAGATPDFGPAPDTFLAERRAAAAKKAAAKTKRRQRGG